MGAASSAPFGRGSKNQKFSFLIPDFRRGVWGEPTKNGKEIFGFASPLALEKTYEFCYHTYCTVAKIAKASGVPMEDLIK